MKNLTRIIFCILAVTFFISCEPEEIDNSTGLEVENIIDPIGDTGDDDDEVYNKEEYKNG
ncbi:hypothetical protein LB467_15840 [Salegentibacter sp. JZCK2]|uniref:hypothetical protein n=1 Tax=Salegentibacter tibetensis TaxID=2873600 RepID=UPI001CCD996A|nr:hypothetical protein [Salegentibacter tibetensis]MBZ9731166.1 hypothetical protein [Salegentibacter tibetensis]